jgi:PAS domain S-box-containing protein
LAQFSAPRWRTGLSRCHKTLIPAAGLCIFAVAYYLAFKFSVDQATKVPSPFWLPNCFLLCALLRTHPKNWWLILLITVPIRLTDNVIPAHPVWFRIGATGISIIQALAGAWAFRSIAPNPKRFGSWRDWVALGAVLVIAAGAAFLTAGLRLALGQDLWLSFELEFAGDALALLVVTPALLTWLFWKDAPAAPSGAFARIEAALLLATLLLTSYFVFIFSSPDISESKFFLPVPLLYWAALRFGMAGASIAVLILTWFVIHSHPLLDMIGLLRQSIAFDTDLGMTPAATLSRFLLFRVVPVYVVAGLVERRQRAELMLQENRQLLQSMIENTPAAVAMLDTEMRYVAYSKRWLTDYRLGDRDLIGLSHYEVFPEIGEGMKAVHRRCMAGARDSSERTAFRRVDGTVDIVRWEVQPWIKGSGEIGGITIFSEVITDRVRADEERSLLRDQLLEAQKFEALGTLAGGIAHDFNNIIAMIGTNAELGLAESAKENVVRVSFREILGATARAKDVVRQILLFSRKQEAAFTTVSLLPIMDDAVSLLSATLPANVEIRKSFEPGIPPVRANASQIYQVLMNLGTNAAYAMSSGGVLSIGLETVNRTNVKGAMLGDLHADKYVRMSVQDTGTGMSSETLERIFDPFFTTKGFEGTGLGMSVVHGIVKAHGGAISVDSELGRGSSVHVFIPAVLENPARAPHGGEEAVRGNGQHIMYIDDEVSLGSAMKRTLVLLGYQCTFYSDPQAALEAILINPSQFNAVISDMIMPRLSGIDIAREIYAISPNLPVALTSGKMETDIETLVDRKNVKAWIAKPATLAEISNALAVMLGDNAG